MDDDLYELLTDWTLHLRSANKAPRTIRSYVDTAYRFVHWLIVTKRSVYATEVKHTDLREYFTHLQTSKTEKTGKPMTPASVAVAYRSLQQYFRWLADVEEVIEVSPFIKMTAPHVPEKPVPVVSDTQLVKLLDSCKGKTFENRRDEALIRLFLDTGTRCAEVAGITIDDVDFETLTVTVMGKGRRIRQIPIGIKTAEALRRYWRMRDKHPRSGNTKALWLGKKGDFTDFGIRQMLNRRTEATGLPHIHPHMFRHTFAHTWLANGGQEGDLQRIAGWRSRDMLDRYGASAASERAQTAHKRMALGDRY